MTDSLAGASSAAQSTAADVRRQGGWLPDNQDVLEEWLSGHRDRVAAKGGETPLHPVLREFQALIDGDPVVRLYLNEMIAQVPRNRHYSKRHLESVPQLLQLVNEVLTMAPEYNEDAMIVLPLGAILDWTMGTPAGFAAFRDRRINAMLKKILGVWCEYLSSADSRYVLNDSPSGWKGEAARRAIGIDQYQHDPEDQYWGFASWNDFFTRRLADGARPVSEPDDGSVIVSACESTPYGLAVDVQLQDQFWLKSQPYSLQDMLGNDESAADFAGGTVYQAFLSATNYHRWQSPVAGTIVRAFVLDGTYYSEADSEGADAVEPRYSQSYLAHVASRAVILIEADNPAIGLTALVPVGMSEVSSCMIDQKIVPAITSGRARSSVTFSSAGQPTASSSARAPSPTSPWARSRSRTFRSLPWYGSARNSPPRRQRVRAVETSESATIPERVSWSSPAAAHSVGGGGRVMTEAGEDSALQALRHGWDDAYEFGVGSGGYWARRRDGLGAALADQDPGEVRRQVQEDYATKPVRGNRRD